MTKSSSRILVISALALTVGTAAPQAHAAAFDAIVPTLYHIDTQGFVGTGTGLGALILPQTSVTQTDLDNMTFIGVEIDPAVDVSLSGPSNTHVFGPAGPGDVLGQSLAGGAFAHLSAALDALVLPGETYKFPGAQFNGVNTNYPDSFVGTVTVNATITSGGDYIDYSFDIIFGDFPDSAKVISAQRLSSVPEPAGLTLLGLGGLAMLRRKA